MRRRLMLAILQARMSSTRLPGKVMRPLLGQPMIARQVERLRRSRRLTAIVVATSARGDDDVLAEWCAAEDVNFYRGDLDDVLSRFLGVLEAKGWPEQFVRLTADCPLADPELIDRVIDEHRASGADYTSMHEGRTFPKGLDVEPVRTAALRAIDALATGEDREHVTRYIYTHPERFAVHTIKRDPPLRYRWTVDTPEDYDFVEAVYTDLYPGNSAFTSDDILGWQARHPDRVLVNDEV